MTILSAVAGASTSPRAARPAPAILFWPWACDQAAVATLLGLLAGSGSDSVVLLPAGGYGGDLAQAIGKSTPAVGEPTRAVGEPTPAGGKPTRARLRILDCDADAGFAAGLEHAVRASGRADLVVIADACILPDGWLAALHGAACSQDTVAGASPLVAGAGEPLFGGLDPADGGGGDGGGVAPAPVHPRIFTLWAHCAYLRRPALDLLGPAEQSLLHPAAVLADLAARALQRGFSCVMADDLCVERLAGGLRPCPEADLRALAARHPWLDLARRDSEALEPGPLRRALIGARLARRRLSVTVDARALGSASGGTQAYTTALVRALVRSGRLTVRAVVADDVAPEALGVLHAEGEVEIVTYAQAVAGVARSDVVHRPQQVFTPDDLALLRLLGERLVITHLDLIAYHSPVYHASPDDWRGYRRTTRLALAAADRVLFLSEHARRDAFSEDLIEPGRTALTGIGIEPKQTALAGAGIEPEETALEGTGIESDERERLQVPERLQAPGGVASVRELLVMIGADYVHKNRTFALALADELREHHGWDGLLVLAGAHVPHGSSAPAEAELLRERPALAAHVLDLGPVSEAEKHWLLTHARALLCPSTYEGYGLTPLEAASAGLPCLYAPFTSLAEVVGPHAATIVPWNAAVSAEAAIGLLREGETRERHLTLLSQALSRCEWGPIVDHLIRTYRDAVTSPYRTSAPRAFEDLQRERLIAELHAGHRELGVRLAVLDAAYLDLEARVAGGLPLIDRGGLLTEAQQRGLMRIAARGWLRKPLLGPVGLLGGRGENR